MRKIVSGEKTEEYRDVTPELLSKICNLDSEGNATSFKDVNSITLYAGYRKDRRFARVEILSIEVDNYLDDENNPIDGDEYFVFMLGRIIETNIS